MNRFQQINDYIYNLVPDSLEYGSSVTLVKDEYTFLVDCLSSDYAVTEVLLPALKNIGYSVKDIDFVIFTHCHEENIGGAHKLKQLNPQIQFLGYSTQIDRLRNPFFHISRLFSNFQEYAPPAKEIQGVIVDGAVSEDSAVFENLIPISAFGHSPCSVCWYHKSSKTMICGDCIQGDGNEVTGVAFFSNYSRYIKTLQNLQSYEISTMLCGTGFIHVPSVITDKKLIDNAISKSIEIVNTYLDFITKYKNEKKTSSVDTLEIVEKYFEKKTKPQYLAYSLLTFEKLC